MMEVIALISTYVVFGGIGYLLSRRLKKPLTANIWIILGVATILSQWIMPGARVMFKVCVNSEPERIG